MYNKTDQIDYIFYDLSVSLNITDKASIQENFKLISADPIEPISCKPIARKFYYSKGQLLYEADIYVHNQCLGYVFLKDEVPIFANRLSQQGVNYYSGILSSYSK